MFIRATSTDDNFWLYALDRLIIPLAYMGFNVVVVHEYIYEYIYSSYQHNMIHYVNTIYLLMHCDV